MAKPSSTTSRRSANAKRTPPAGPPLHLQGSLWLSVGEQSLGGPGRMALLRAVAEHGSITHAARAIGISYKAAWDAIDAMNQLAGTALVERVAGGRGGGGTRLTAHGQRCVERFEKIDAVHQRFVRLLSDQNLDLGQDFSLLKALNVKTSARNQWLGSVRAVRAGAVNDEVELRLPGQTHLVATVTQGSRERLGLRPQQVVIAMVKASSVMLAADLGPARLSADNRLDGTVMALRPGAVNAEVVLQATGGLEVVAIVSLASAQALGLAPGRAVTALIKAADVILAVEG